MTHITEHENWPTIRLCLWIVGIGILAMIAFYHAGSKFTQEQQGMEIARP